MNSCEFLVVDGIIFKSWFGNKFQRPFARAHELVIRPFEKVSQVFPKKALFRSLNMSLSASFVASALILTRFFPQTLHRHELLQVSFRVRRITSGS